MGFSEIHLVGLASYHFAILLASAHKSIILRARGVCNLSKHLENRLQVVLMPFRAWPTNYLSFTDAFNG
jgi:hypothetical protein